LVAWAIPMQDSSASRILAWSACPRYAHAYAWVFILCVDFWPTLYQCILVVIVM